MTGSATGFERRFVIGWGQADLNGHVRNSAYLDLATDTRMMFFAAHGFAPAEFTRLGVGPVVLRDELDYTRELLLLDEVRVNVVLLGSTADFRRCRIRNEFFRAEEKVAQLVSVLGWLDLATRKLTLPPPPLARVLEGMPRAGEFVTL